MSLRPTENCMNTLRQLKPRKRKDDWLSMDTVAKWMQKEQETKSSPSIEQVGTSTMGGRNPS